MTAPDEQMIERAVSGLCKLHEKMLLAVETKRPYPVSIVLGASDTDAVLNAAVALERARAAHSVMAGEVAELTELLEQSRPYVGWHTRPTTAGAGGLLAKIDAALAPYPEGTK